MGKQNCPTQSLMLNHHVFSLRWTWVYGYTAHYRSLIFKDIVTQFQSWIPIQFQPLFPSRISRIPVSQSLTNSTSSGTTSPSAFNPWPRAYQPASPRQNAWPLREVFQRPRRLGAEMGRSMAKPRILGKLWEIIADFIADMWKLRKPMATLW